MDFDDINKLSERLLYEVEAYRREKNINLDRYEYLNTRAFEVSMQILYNKESAGGRTVCSSAGDVKKIAALRQIICSGMESNVTRFAAFVFLFTAYRREKHPNQVRELVEECRDYFGHFRIYLEYDLLSVRNKGVYKEEDVPQLINKCRSVCESNPDNVGATNSAAEVIASLADRGLIDEDQKSQLVNAYIVRME